MSLVKILAFSDVLVFILRFIYWEQVEFEEISTSSLSNIYFWIRVALWICRAGFSLTVLFMKPKKLEFVDMLGVLIVSGLIGVIGEMFLLNQYMSLKKLDWYGIFQLGLEIGILKIIDAKEEFVLRREREKERKTFRRDLQYRY